jgi:hypothetical protein
LIHQETFSSADEARLRGLVEASATGDLPEDTRRRVYASVLSRHETRGRARVAILRPAVVFTVLLVAAGATTAATLGRRWIEQRERAAAVSALPPSAPKVERPTARSITVDPVVVSPVEESLPEPPSVRRSPNRARPRSEDPSEVVRAVDALRNQHDPERAAKLLAQYLATHPRGALVEEAVALSIEAAVARQDPGASDFARRYLRDYPNGRFRQTAQAVLQRR